MTCRSRPTRPTHRAATLLCWLLCGACGAPGATTQSGPATPRPRAAPQPRPARAPATATHGITPPGERVRTRPPAAPLRQAKSTLRLRLGLGGHAQLPARWWVRPHAGKAGWVEVWGPDRQLWLALVALRADSPQAAMRAAWKRARPGTTLQVKATQRPPSASGWDEVVQRVYVTPARAQRLRLALARRKGKAYFVALLDTPIAALGRRSAQLNQLLGSLKAPGVTEESFSGKPAHRLDARRIAAFEAFVRKARKALDVVGAAVAIVQGGKVIYKKGFGHRRKGGRARVTPRTIFMIGSITKTFTGMLMARLVDEKRFTWQTPVTQVYPRFALGDPALTRKCQMRHTLCACTGLPRQDMEFLFEYGKATAASRMKLLSTMRPTTGFGETFQYSNLMVAAAGYVAGHAAYPRLPLGRAYAKALSSRILRPLGMRRTTLSMARARRLEHAMPHSLDFSGRPVPIPLAYEKTVESVGPAGGLWSNVEDMARYALVQLGQGRTPAGLRVVSEKNLTTLWRPGARIDAHRAYGLAMIVNRAHSIRILGHGGGTLGFSTNFVFLPDHGVALISLHNVGGGAGGFNSLLLRRLLELLFDASPKAEALLSYAVRTLHKRRAESAKRIDPRPPESWLRPLLGTYHNAALGSIVLRLRGGRAELDAGEWRAPVARFRPDKGAPEVLIGPPLTGVRLVPGKRPDGRRTLALNAVQQRYEFVRVR